MQSANPLDATAGAAEMTDPKTMLLEQAAEQVPCSRPYLWELEQDRAKNPTLRLCHGLAELYGLTLDRMAAHLLNPPTDTKEPTNG